MIFLTIGVLAAMLAGQAPATLGTPVPNVPTWCPVTLPNEVRPANFEPETGWYGKDGLYTNVRPDGTYNAIIMPGREEKGAWNKRVWVREPPEPISITMRFIGERITTGEPEVNVVEPGSERMPVQATDTWFPEPGCWTITATTPTRSLKIVVWVHFIHSEDYDTPISADRADGPDTPTPSGQE